MEKNLDLLRRFIYLRGFTSKTLQKLSKHLVVEEVSHQGLLYKQGDPFTHFYLLILGEYDQIWAEQSAVGGAKELRALSPSQQKQRRKDAKAEARNQS